MNIRLTLIILTSIFTFPSFGQDQLNQLFAAESSYEHFSGNVLVQKSDGTEFRFSSGYSNIDESEPISFDHTFDIGSLSKQFTASAILHLAHDSLINLNAPINLYLKNMGSRRWKKITVHQLLTHSSGIPSLFQSGQGLEKILPNENEIELDELIRYFKDKKLRFKPGTQYAYSNSGYILLAKIIENVTHQSYQSYINQMFRKYNLDHTSFGLPKNPVARPYIGYRRDLMQDRPEFHYSWTIGAGGIYSSITDLQRWVELIQSDQFLNQHYRELFLGQHQPKRGGYYGYGWEILTSNNETTYQHDGAMFGYISYLGFRPASGELVVMLTNQTHGSFTTIGKSQEYVMSLKDKIWRTLAGNEIDILPQRTDSMVIEGSYTFDDGYQLTIKKCDSIYQVSGNGTYAPSRLAFHQPFEEKGDRADKLRAIAQQVPHKKYRKIAWAFSKEMKFVIRSGLFRMGFGMVTSGIGEIIDSKPFYIDEKTARFRLYGTDEILDMILYFNDAGEVQGIFENGYHEYFNENRILAYPVADNELYLDGFPYGEFSATLKLTDDKLVYSQMGREFIATRISQ